MMHIPIMDQEERLGKTKRSVSTTTVLRWVVSCFIVAACVRSAQCQQWTESFEDGLGGTSPYHNDEPAAELEMASDNPADGKQFLRIKLPGKRRLEGAGMTAPGLSGGRLATVTARVRGRGRIWLCLISANGWLYSPNTVRLTNQWQTVSLNKALMVRDKSLGIHFLARELQQGSVFEVDDIRVTLADPPKVVDAEVRPWRFEAEEFAPRRADVAKDQSASGGRVLRSQQYGRLVSLPFPRTGRPVAVYLRVKARSAGPTYRLITTQGGNTQLLGSVTLKSAKQWQWVRFPNVLVGQ